MTLPARASARLPPFDRAVEGLCAVRHRFDPDAADAKRAALKAVTRLTLRTTPALARYHDALLMLCAHPADAAMQRAVEAELRRVTQFLRRAGGDVPAHLQGEGLPFVDTVTRFSHDAVRWLLGHADVQVTIDQCVDPRMDLNQVLALTLPSLERNETTAGLDNDALLDALKLAPAQRLAFIVNELGRLDASPYVKDLLFDALDLFVRVRPRHARFSKSGNRLPVAEVFMQTSLWRRFDVRGLLDQALPAPRALDERARAQVIEVLRNTMALTSRETDPTTYLDPASLRVLDLDRGLTVALYGMTPDRQLPLESYVGFTLFKNGLAVAYGGAWVLGARAAFGMNIFEPYRGGESGYMMCQVLRSYRQTFQVDFFEVDAHQFGLDNPDGIATGAYWFYDRHGFRPLDPALARLAQRERDTMARRPGHRSSVATLVRLTGSNVALNFGHTRPPHLFDLTTRVTRWIQRRHRGDRRRAEVEAVDRFNLRSGLPVDLPEAQGRVRVEVALLAAALDISDDRRIALLRDMVRTKPTDLAAYQAAWLAFFEPTPSGRGAPRRQA